MFKMSVWESITRQLNTQIGKNLLTQKVIQKHIRLRKKTTKIGIAFESHRLRVG